MNKINERMRTIQVELDERNETIQQETYNMMSLQQKLANSQDQPVEFMSYQSQFLKTSDARSVELEARDYLLEELENLRDQLLILESRLLK